MILEKVLLDRLVALDAQGFIPGENESVEAFSARVVRTRKRLIEFENALASQEKVQVFDSFDVCSADKIAPELIGEAAEKTFELYRFSIRYVPGFYLTEKVGWLWGGCMIADVENDFSLFLLRGAFRKKRKFLNYFREELLAHELCHAARTALHDSVLEEYFAYQTSPSKLRRYLGNCFISEKDAYLFLFPVLLLPVAEFVRFRFLSGFPSWIFWVIALIYPLFLLIRNALSRFQVKRAGENLKKAGITHPSAVLFRMSYSEIKEFAGKNPSDIPALIAEKAQQLPRWAVIAELIKRGIV